MCSRANQYLSFNQVSLSDRKKVEAKLGNSDDNEELIFTGIPMRSGFPIHIGIVITVQNLSVRIRRVWMRSEQPTFWKWKMPLSKAMTVSFCWEHVLLESATNMFALQIKYQTFRFPISRS